MLNDPDSYEHVRSTLPFPEGDHWAVEMTFRAKNGFGAKMLATKKFSIRNGRVIGMVDVK